MTLIDRKRASLLLCLASCLALSACGGEHVHSTGILSYESDPGYVWVNPDDWGLAVRWTPGADHPSYPHIVAAAAADQWQPLPGYHWDDGDEPTRASAGTLSVHWQAGLAHPSFPHIASAVAEGSWHADPGYRFESRDSLRVFWQAGSSDPNRPHMLAAAAEGQWEPAPGYALWTDTSGRQSAYWSSGLLHPAEPCLRASQTEGEWIPIQGYHVERTSDNRFQLVGDQTDWGGVVVGALTFLIGGSMSQEHEDDSNLDRAGHHLAGEVARAGLDHAIESASGGACAGHILDARFTGTETGSPSGNGM